MHILLIENPSAALTDLKHGLHQQAIAADSAATIKEGDLKARSGAFDVIVLDLTLARIDALALVRDWRRSGLKTPVLFLVSPGALPEMAQEPADLGASDFLTKPFKWEEFLVRLHYLFRRNQHVKNVVMRICDLEIDTVSRAVTRSGRPINLTPREFSLLHFLARHRGSVVSRSEIRANLYSDKRGNTSNVVDVYIRYLRTKIDKGFSQPLILTRWGEGYLVRDEAI